MESVRLLDFSNTIHIFHHTINFTNYQVPQLPNSPYSRFFPSNNQSSSAPPTAPYPAAFSASDYPSPSASGRASVLPCNLASEFYQPHGINLADIRRLVEARAAGRRNWLIGAGGEAAAKTIRRLHERGLTGPLWEYLAQ